MLNRVFSRYFAFQWLMDYIVKSRNNLGVRLIKSQVIVYQAVDSLYSNFFVSYRFFLQQFLQRLEPFPEGLMRLPDHHKRLRIAFLVVFFCVTFRSTASPFFLYGDRIPVLAFRGTCKGSALRGKGRQEEYLPPLTIVFKFYFSIK